MSLNKFMHPRNIYRTPPDFKELASISPEFQEHVKVNERGKFHVDFKDANALRSLTKALLKKDFGLSVEIPENCLIPTVPQRLNYILWIEDLLNLLPTSDKFVRGIDVGTGPCCIFSVLGAKKNGWHFVASESEEESLMWARKNVESNGLQDLIELIKTEKETILKEIIPSSDEALDFCLCNPPFFHDLEEVNQRKSPSKVKQADLDFKESEVYSPGGEVSFVKRMIDDSVILKGKIKIYTSMLGKKRSLIPIKNELRRVNAEYTCTEFCQGNTMRWGVAWTFCDGIKFNQINCPKRKKQGKAISYDIPQTIEGIEYTINGVLKCIKSILREFEIIYGVKKKNKQNAIFWMKSKKNTWSHQRRKKRMTLLHAKTSDAGDIESSINNEADSEILASSHGDYPAMKLNADITENNKLGRKQDAAEDTNVGQLLVSDLQSTKRKFDVLDSSSLNPPKKVKNDCTSHESKGSSNSCSSSNSEPPLLLCDAHLKKNEDIISLEINCSEDCNRQSMNEILQLLKNRLK